MGLGQRMKSLGIRKKLGSAFLFLLGSAGVLVWFGINNLAEIEMPDYATVYLDDDAKTYIALICMDEWRNTSDGPSAVARRSTAGEAWRLHYRPDRDCLEAGKFVQHEWMGLYFLAKIGILSHWPQRWWDYPLPERYRSAYIVMRRGQS